VGSAVPASQTLIRGGSEAEFVGQLSDTAFDVVADGANGWGAEVRGVVDVVPGFVAFAGKNGTGIAAAHGDHNVGGADGFVGPWFGELVGESIPRSGSHGRDCGVDAEGAPGGDGHNALPAGA
jgi:hypothetical protein